MESIPEKYPPLRKWMEQLRADMEAQRTVLNILEGRLAFCEALMDEVMKEKEGHNEH